MDNFKKVLETGVFINNVCIYLNDIYLLNNMGVMVDFGSLVCMLGVFIFNVYGMDWHYGSDGAVYTKP